jgi:DNA-directed RNA polymerase subunit RPC12/RpoP
VKFCIDCHEPCYKDSIRCKTCSNKEIASRVSRNQKLSKSHTIPNKERCCIDCGKSLSRNAYYYGYKRCGSCATKFIFKDKTKHPRYKVKLTQEIKDKISKSEKGKIISEIQRKRLSELFSDKGNPRYIDGRSYLPYTKEFNDELKEKIRKRDNYTCQCCGMTEEEHIIVCGCVLTVHHIDYNKINSKEDNLITTCKNCNSRANSNREYWKEFYKKKVEAING